MLQSTGLSATEKLSHGSCLTGGWTGAVVSTSGTSGTSIGGLHVAPMSVLSGLVLALFGRTIVSSWHAWPWMGGPVVSNIRVAFSSVVASSCCCSSVDASAGKSPAADSGAGVEACLALPRERV